jgi:predicted transcriptional regulator
MFRGGKMLPDVREIEKRRKQAGLTQKELAIRSGVSQSIIAKIETGKVNPSYDVVRKIFESLENMTRKEDVTAVQICSKGVHVAKRDESVGSAVKLMRSGGYSQLPVVDRGHVVGTLSEKTILDAISGGIDLKDMLKKKVVSVMSEAPPMIGENEPMSVISSLLQNNQAVLVVKRDKLVGIITKADLFKIAKK